MIITNFKTYESATGEAALRLAKAHEDAAKETGADIQVVPQAVDLARLCHELSIPVLAQHIDPVGYGSHTGHILPESIQMAGAAGTLLNHSENRLEREVLKASILRAKEVGLKTIVCAKDPEEGASFPEAFQHDGHCDRCQRIDGGTPRF